MRSAGSDASALVARACDTQVHLIQSLMPAIQAGSKMQLSSHGAQPVGRDPGGSWLSGGSSAVALSLQSLLRVAASEYPTTAWASVDAGAAASPYLAERGQLAQAGAAHLAASDMYGHALHCGVMKAPKLVVREPYMAPGKKVSTGKSIAHAFPERTGSIVVTGGLGALGTMVAVWLATDGGYDLWLLGRSGRSGEQLPEEIYNSTAQVHCAKCDVSAVEEASYIVAASGSTGKVLRSIMHAGAVLVSKVISNISAGSIRTEYSGTST